MHPEPHHMGRAKLLAGYWLDAEQVGSIKSPKFTRAFFGMFLGENPVSRDGKRNIQSGLARFVTEE